MASAEGELELDIQPALDALDKLDEAFNEIVSNFGDTLAKTLDDVFDEALRSLDSGFDSSVNAFATSLSETFDSISTQPIELTISDGALQESLTEQINDAIQPSQFDPIELTVNEDLLVASISDAIEFAVNDPVTLLIDEDALSESLASAFESAISEATGGIDAAAGAGSQSLFDQFAGAGGIASGLLDTGAAATIATRQINGTAIATTGLATASAGATGAFGALITRAVPGLAVFTGVTLAVKSLAERAEQAQLSNERLNSVLGKSAAAFDNITIGTVTKSLAEFNKQTGSSGTQLRLAIANFAQLGVSAGKSQGQVANQTKGLIALSQTLSVSNPSLGTADRIFTQLQRGLARGGPILNRFGISLTRAQIQQEAFNQTGKTTVRELTQYELAVAGSTLATGQLGKEFANFDENSKSTTVRLRALRQEIAAGLTVAAAPLLEPFSKIVESLTPIGVAISKIFVGLLAAVVPIAAAIAVALAGIIKAFEPFQDDFFKGVTDGIKEFSRAVDGAISGITGALTPALKQLDTVLGTGFFGAILKDFGKFVGFAGGAAVSVLLLKGAFALLIPVVGKLPALFALISKNPLVVGITAAALAVSFLTSKFEFLDDLLGGDASTTIIITAAAFLGLTQVLGFLAPALVAATQAVLGFSAATRVAAALAGPIGIALAAAGALAIGFGLFGGSAKEASTDTAELSDQIFKVGKTSANALPSVEALTENIAKFITKSGEAKGLRDYSDGLNRIGVSQADVVKAIINGSSALPLFDKRISESKAREVIGSLNEVLRESLDETLTLRDAANQLGISYETVRAAQDRLSPGADAGVQSYKKTREAVRGAADATLAQGVALDLITLKEANNIKGTRNRLIAAQKVKVAIQEQAAATEIASQVEAVQNQQQSITTSALGKHADAWRFLAANIATGATTLADAATVSAQFGIGVQDVSKFIDQVNQSLDAFVQAALSKLPTVSDALNALGNPAGLQEAVTSAQEDLAKLSSNADSTAEEIGAANQKVIDAQEALKRSIDPQAFVDQLLKQQAEVGKFLDNIAELSARGNRKLAQFLAEQGPSAAGQAQAFIDAGKDAAVVKAAEDSLGPAGDALTARAKEIYKQVGVVSVDGATQASGMYGIQFVNGIATATATGVGAIAPAIDNGLGAALVAAAEAGIKIRKATAGDVSLLPADLAQILIDSGVAVKLSSATVIDAAGNASERTQVKFKENFNPATAVADGMGKIPSAITEQQAPAEAAAATVGTAVGKKLTVTVASGIHDNRSVIREAAEHDLSVALRNSTGVATLQGVALGFAIDSGIAAGILINAGVVNAAGKALIAGLDKNVRKLLGIASPSRVMADRVGSPIAQGIALGIREATPDVISAINDLNSAALNATLAGSVGQVSLDTPQVSLAGAVAGNAVGTAAGVIGSGPGSAPATGGVGLAGVTGGVNIENLNVTGVKNEVQAGFEAARQLRAESFRSGR